jgi:hypothetical protein
LARGRTITNHRAAIGARTIGGITMPSIIHRVLSTRKRRIAAIAGLTTATLAGVAVAYILITFTGSTTAASAQALPTQASSQDVSSALVFDNGSPGTPWSAGSLTVGGAPAPYRLVFNQLGTSPAGSVNSVTITPSVDSAHAAACPVADFAVTNTMTYPLTIPANPSGGVVPVAQGVVQLNSDPNVNQAGCAGAIVTLSATLNP